MNQHSLSEKKIRQVVEEWQATFDAIPDPVSIIDCDFRLRAVNRAFTNAFKMKPEDLLGKKCHEIMHHTAEPWPDCPHRQSNASNCVVTEEFLEPRLGLFLQVTCSPIRNERGEPVGTVHIARDITERKKAEDALRQARDGIQKQVDRQTEALTRANEDLTASIERMRSEMEKREAAESAMKEQLRFEMLLAEISTFFINLPADRIDSEIEAAQRRVCEFLDLDRAALFQADEEDPGTLRMTHFYQPAGSPIPPERMSLKEFFPWSLPKVLGGETITISKMTDLPAEAARDRETFGLCGTRSVVIAPLAVGTRGVFGLLTFAVMREEREWTQTDSTVLILGETGTGKELLARAIHRMSARNARPLVTVNCASLPPALIESELFGREKGAYTGALTQMIGRFEIADQSTLFLDEIGEIPLELQSKLLRVLEAGRFERLGSAKTLQVNVRIIAATNRDLAQAVQADGFRKDLFYRLNVFPIVMPPLREHPDDIPLMVWSFVKEFQKKMGRRIEHIPKDIMQKLQSHGWPGNVRELRNVIERAMIMSTGETLVVDLAEFSSSQTKAAGELENMERSYITAVLAKAGWRVGGKGGAAEILGLNRTTLYSKIKKLGIHRPNP